MAPPTTPSPGARPPSRRPSSLAAALALLAVAAVAAGAAWAGRAGRAAPPAAAAAPAPPTAPTSEPGALAGDAKVLLDGGNAAFRAGNFEAALAHYRAAAAKAPRSAAPWFGIHMAAQKLGRAALADSALAAVKARSDSPGSWDDSATRRAHAESPGPRRP